MGLKIFLCIVASLLLLSQFHSLVDGQEAIGVNYGMLIQYLPDPRQVIALCKSKTIARLRIFKPNRGVLDALKNSGIELVLGTGNADLPALGRDPNFARQWVQNNVKKYVPYVKFRYMVIGDEVIPAEIAPPVMLAAMQNLKTALHAQGLHTPVTMSVFHCVLSFSDPPSISQFSVAAIAILKWIIPFLEANKYPLLVHAFPYLTYAAEPSRVRLDYALFNTTDVVVRDGNRGYKNLFDAMVDSVYWALQKVGALKVEVVVSESGWPWFGGDGKVTTMKKAMAYNNNLIAHLRSGNGTPLKPGKKIEAYLFALFDEDMRPGDSEKNWGMFYLNMTPIYPIRFNP